MTMPAVRYHVLHETRYDYGSPVSLSQQQLHLSPRILAWQQVEEQCVDIEPTPSWRRDDLDATRFLFESPHVRIKHELADYAADCFPPGKPLLLCVQALMAKIFTEFTFDPEATTVSTPVLDVLENKRGVCQDFAHLMIACLRALGLAARYVSGYLLTRPPPGKPRLIGADASHAWVSVYVPGSEYGWVDFDPTNNLLPDTEHITLSFGRDFSDISPLRGIILGGGGAEPEVAVTVFPIEEEDMPKELLAAIEARKGAG